MQLLILLGFAMKRYIIKTNANKNKRFFNLPKYPTGSIGTDQVHVKNGV